MSEQFVLTDSLFSIDAPLTEVNVTRWRHGELSKVQDKVAEEVPIALVYNGVSHAVMLATPLDLEDFALGFSLSEGILRDKSDLYDIEVVKQPQGIELRLEIASECFAKLKERRRNLVGRTGCGICGAESLEQALRLPQMDNSNKNAVSKPLLAVNIQAAFHAIQNKQTLQQATGATHACAWIDAQGEAVLVREDVGRHNAMDKLIGALARQENNSQDNNRQENKEPKRPNQHDGFVLTSSRASVEMVQKVATAGIEVLAAISAPTGLAIRIAETYGVTLIGFLRDNQFVIYAHKQRVQF